MKILVVEDDPVSRLLLTRALEKLGHQTLAAENGAKGFEAFVAHSPELVVTDWQMPELNGGELCRQIRALRRSRYPYLIVLTARTDKQSFLDGHEAGADDFLTKPLDLDELGVRLRVAQRMLQLQHEVRTLEGLLPICAYCKKIRDGEAWVPVERYMSARSGAEFSHSICVSCLDHHFPE